jgi:hypothetical protein
VDAGSEAGRRRQTAGRQQYDRERSPHARCCAVASQSGFAFDEGP